MIARALLTGISLALGALAMPAAAQVNIESVNTCVTGAIESGTSPTECIEQAHTDCLNAMADTPTVATLCFVTAKEAWNAGISTAMSDVTAIASETIAAIAGVELKYDILGNLVQCDRMEELALLAETASPEQILLQKTRCTARALGMAYIRLRWRADQL